MARLSRVDISYLDCGLADLVTLVVSRDNSCRFCLAGARILLRMTGRLEAGIESLESGLVAAEQSPKDRLGLEFARRLSRCNPPPSPGDVQKLREVDFSREEILELAFATIQYVAINRINTMVALPLEFVERADRSILTGPLRLLFRRLIEARRTHLSPVFLSDEERTGPFTAEVTRLDGLPAGRTLRQILDEAWSSPILSGRAKSLVFAVVARGLGASRVESEAMTLLIAEGCERREVEDVLAHLASPSLDPIESALVLFAPETLWYEPAPLQRRVRELRGQLSDAELLEAIGITAWANAVCRLSLALEAIE
jgi:AhpD family alkylhydroperoxidase